MAKRTGKVVVDGTSKAELIRKYRAEHPEAMPVEVVAALRRQGVTTDAGYVSTISHVAKKRAQKSESISTDALMGARRLIDLLGGVEEAREMLESLERTGVRPMLHAIDLIAQLRS